MADVIEVDFGHVQPEDEGHQPPLQDPALCPHPKDKIVLKAVCLECSSETEVAREAW